MNKANDYRTLDALRNSLEGKIYLYLKDGETVTRFLEDAREQGYLFGEFAPDEAHRDNLVSLKKEKQLAHVGTVGRIEYMCNGGDGSRGRFHRIDYSKYVNGDKEYSI
ncbi:MAG: hypothetical protein IJS90_00365 [Clostridia bacterium]|nr:hypothetical protein [Clostridia bacterium]